MRSILSENNIDVRNLISQGTEIDALAFANAGIARLLLHSRREIVDAIDLASFWRQPLAELSNIKPFVRRAF